MPVFHNYRPSSPNMEVMESAVLPQELAHQSRYKPSSPVMEVIEDVGSQKLKDDAINLLKACEISRILDQIENQGTFEEVTGDNVIDTKDEDVKRFYENFTDYMTKR
jgi:hypothetical protein